jgi:hypothetical protein
MPTFYLGHRRDCFASVGTIRRRRFWMVFVSDCDVLILLKSLFSSVCFLWFSDSVWPVRFRFEPFRVHALTDSRRDAAHDWAYPRPDYK